MECARIVRVALYDRFDGFHDLDRPLVGLPVGRPVAPGTEIHRCLRIERGGVQIVRVQSCQLAHGGGISHVTGGAILGLPEYRSARA